MQKLSGGLLLALALLTAAGPLGIDMYLPGMPELATQLSTSPSSAQLTISGFMLGMALGNLVFGAISDGTGRKPAILVASAVALAASVACAVAPSISFLIAARFLQGLAGGCAVVVTRAVIPDIAHGREAARGLSGLMAISGFMPAIAPVLGGLIIPTFTWRGVFWTIAAVNLAQILIAWRFVPETLPPEQRTRGTLRTIFPRMVQCLRRPAFLGYMFAAGLGFGTLFSYISASPLVLQVQLGVTPTTFSLIFGGIALLIPLSNSINMRLVKTHQPRTLLVVALSVDILAGLILLAYSQLGPNLTMLPFIAILSAMAGFIMANASALAVEEIRDIGIGAGTGAMGFFQFIIGGLVPPLVALGSNPTASMANGILTCAGLALLGVLLGSAAPHSGSKNI